MSSSSLFSPGLRPVPLLLLLLGRPLQTEVTSTDPPAVDEDEEDEEEEEDFDFRTNLNGLPLRR